MVKRGTWSLWDYLLWLGIILILGWALLKSLGIIGTPVWVQMIPIFGIVIVFIAGIFKAGKMAQNIETMGGDIGGLKEKIGQINDNLISLSERVTLRDEQIKKLDEDVRQFKNPKK